MNRRPQTSISCTHTFPFGPRDLNQLTRCMSSHNNIIRRLLALIFLFAFTITWYTWPDRTFRAFKTAVLNQRFDIANSMVNKSTNTATDGSVFDCTFDATSTGIHLNSHILERHSSAEGFIKYLKPNQRSIADILLARRTYEVWNKDPSFIAGDPITMIRMSGGWSPRFEFIVERGKLTIVASKSDDRDDTGSVDYVDPTSLGL